MKLYRNPYVKQFFLRKGFQCFRRLIVSNVSRTKSKTGDFQAQVTYLRLAPAHNPFIRSDGHCACPPSFPWTGEGELWKLENRLA